ncbi:MAG: dihydrodipicolinate synthase family protein [Bryobacterales bacterium]
MKLQGILVPVATPFDHRGDLYVSKVHYNFSRWNRTHLAGYIVGSSCGESRMLSLDEKRTLWEEAARASDGEKLLLAGVSADGVRETVRAIDCAQALGYKAAVVEPPQYPRPWVEGAQAQATYFRAVADQAKMPLVIFNPRAGAAVRLSAETVLSLSKHPGIAGVIDASANEDSIRRLVEQAGDGFAVLCGEDTLLHAGLAAGAAGAVPALANAAPFFCLSIGEAVRTRELASAAELQERARAAAEAVTTQYGIAGLKYAMDLRGYYGGNPRLPLLPLSGDARERIAAAFAGINS